VAVVGRFEFGGRNVAARLVAALVIEPVDVVEDGGLDVLSGAPGPALMDQVGLAQADHRLGEASPRLSRLGESSGERFADGVRRPLCSPRPARSRSLPAKTSGIDVGHSLDTTLRATLAIMIADEPRLVATEWEILDRRFRSCRGDKWLERLHTGSRWAEGPVWVPGGRYLLWSDVAGNRLLRWDETTGAVGVFRSPSGFANGNTLDRGGRLVTCEQEGRRVTRTEHDGSITVLADRFDGRRLNSPNDVVVASDGSVWFTDPVYGIVSHYEGDKSASEIGASHLYRIEPATGALAVAADGFDQPNGLCFSPDEKLLYVSDTGRGHMRVFAVGDNGTLSGGDEFAVCTAGVFDGFRVDDEERVWASAADGVHCYDPDGTLIGKLHVPEVVANVAFGGRRRNQLFLAATTSLYTVYLGARGPRWPGVIASL
jgi:gluconolactonase